MLHTRRIPICLVLAAVLALACAAPSLAHGPGVRAWLTTGDQSSLLAEQPPAALGAPDPAAPTIAVDPAALLPAHRGPRRLDHRLLGAPARPLARSRRDHALALRPAPAASGSATCASRWAPRTSSPGRTTPTTTSPPGQTDFRLKHFSIAHDRAEILPLLRQALRLNPSLKIMATPWSPPAWMKTNDSLVGGRFKDDPRVYDAYAQLLRALRPGVPARRRPDRRRHAAERAAEPQSERVSGHGPARRRGGAAGRRGRARLPARRGSTRRSSATTTTGRCTPTTSGRPTIRPTPSTPRRCSPTRRRATTSPAPPSTATPAIPSASRSCTTPSRRRTSTSPSARARSRATRPRRSPTPCTGTRASSPSAPSATGPRPSSRGTSRSIPPAAAQRRLRHVLRRRDDRPRHRPRHADGRLLRARPRDALHPPGRGARRLDRGGQRVERRLPQPRRLRRPRRGQRRLGHDDAELQRQRAAGSRSRTRCRRAPSRPSCCRAARRARSTITLGAVVPPAGREKHLH